MKPVLWAAAGFAAIYFLSTRTTAGRVATSALGITGRARGIAEDVHATTTQIRGTVDDVSGIVSSLKQGFGSLFGSGTSASSSGVTDAYFSGGSVAGVGIGGAVGFDSSDDGGGFLGW